MISEKHKHTEKDTMSIREEVQEVIDNREKYDGKATRDYLKKKINVLKDKIKDLEGMIR